MEQFLTMKIDAVYDTAEELCFEFSREVLDQTDSDRPTDDHEPLDRRFRKRAANPAARKPKERAKLIFFLDNAAERKPLVRAWHHPDDER